MSTILEVDRLSFSFHERPVLRNISFSISRGERVGIVGGNGAGKSTLLWCVLGLHKAQGGVRLFGSKPGRATRTHTGVVFQNPEDLLFMPKLIEDITLPLLNRGEKPERAIRQARNLLVTAGLEDYADEPADHLSLGQRKRAAIAAALATAPEFLVMDEPTAELDGRAVRRLAELVSRLDLTCLITGHDLDFLRCVVHRLLVLHDGEIVAAGPVGDILDNRELLDQVGLI